MNSKVLKIGRLMKPFLMVTVTCLIFSLSPATNANELENLPVELIRKVLCLSDGETIASVGCLNSGFNEMVRGSFHLPTIQGVEGQIKLMKEKEDSESISQSLVLVNSLREFWRNRTDARRSATLKFLEGAHQDILSEIVYLYKNLVSIEKRVQFISPILSVSSGDFDLQKTLFNLCSESKTFLSELTKYSSGNFELQNRIFEKSNGEVSALALLASESRGNFSLQDQIWEKTKDGDLGLAKNLANSSQGNFSLQNKIFEKFKNSIGFLLALAKESGGNMPLQEELFKMAKNIPGGFPLTPKWAMIRSLGRQSQGNLDLQEGIKMLPMSDQPGVIKWWVVMGLVEGSKGNGDLQKEMLVRMSDRSCLARELANTVRLKLYLNSADDAQFRLELRDKIFRSAKHLSGKSKALALLALSNSDWDDSAFQEKLFKTLLFKSEPGSNAIRVQALINMISKMELTSSMKRLVRRFAESGLEKADRLKLLALLD